MRSVSPANGSGFGAGIGSGAAGAAQAAVNSSAIAEGGIRTMAAC
jgi:hypothetical protein